MTSDKFLLRSMPRLFTLAAGLLLAIGATGHAATISDNAHIFSASAIQSAQQTIDYIKVHHHKDFNIETFPSIPAEKQGDFSSSQKAAFFSKWADERDRATSTDGVYLLVCMDPPYLQGKVGNATRTKEFTLSDRDALISTVGRDFKAKDFDRGLEDAVQFVKQRMTANTQGGQAAPGNAAPPPAYTPNSAPPQNPAPGASGGFGGIHLGGLICVGAAVLILIALFRGIGRSRTGPGGGGYPPNYQGGYPPNYQGGGYAPRTGGGFGTGLLGGLLGGALGSWGYDEMRNRGGGGGWTGGGGAVGGGDAGAGGGGSDFSTSSGVDTSSSDSGGGGFDFGGGGGGDSGGGGDFGGGGGGDSGGGSSF